MSIAEKITPGPWAIMNADEFLELTFEAQDRLLNVARYPNTSLRELREARAILRKLDEHMTAEDEFYASHYDADGNYIGQEQPA